MARLITTFTRVLASMAGLPVMTQPAFADDRVDMRALQAAVRQGEAAVPVRMPADGVCLAGQFTPTASGRDGRQPRVYPVRQEPRRGAAPHDTVQAGERGYQCDRRLEAARPGEGASAELWHGVVYGRAPDACGLGQPGREGRAYAGPCRWGWVEPAHFMLAPGQDDRLAIIDTPLTGDGD